MFRMTLPAALALALVLACAGPAGSSPAPDAGALRGTCRPYLDFADRAPFVGTYFAGHTRLDQWGIPVVLIGHRYHRSPVLTAHWGLQYFSLWCAGRADADLAVARAAAGSLVASQDADGAWRYDFPWREGPVILRPPWVSSMAQGMAISLLMRVYGVTHEARYLDAAKRALLPFGRRADQGGVTSMWDGRPWFEEYPAPNANHVLNGFEFTLLGLYDLPQSPVARGLFAHGVRSLAWAIPGFDGGPTGSYYASGHYGPVDDGYLSWHVVLTRELYRLTHRRIFAVYADRWAAALAAHGGAVP